MGIKSIKIKKALDFSNSFSVSEKESSLAAWSLKHQKRISRFGTKGFRKLNADFEQGMLDFTMKHMSHHGCLVEGCKKTGIYTDMRGQYSCSGHRDKLKMKGKYQ